MGTGKYELLVLDLTSLDSVRAFAQKILDKNVPINILLNNGRVPALNMVNQFEKRIFSYS